MGGGGGWVGGVGGGGGGWVGGVGGVWGGEVVGVGLQQDRLDATAGPRAKAPLAYTLNTRCGLNKIGLGPRSLLGCGRAWRRCIRK